MKNIKQSLSLACVAAIIFSLFSNYAYAHGDNNHDDEPIKIKKKHVIKDKQALIQQQPLLEEVKDNATILLNAKVSSNPKNIRYVFSDFDGLLSIDKPIILGQVVRKWQILGRVKSILSPIESSNYKMQIASLQGELNQQKAKLKRYQSISELIAQKDIDEANLAITSLTKQINAMQNNIQKSNILVSPINGIVTQSNMNASKFIENKTPLLEISTHDNLEIQAEYYLTNYENNNFNQRSALLIFNQQKIPLIYTGYIPIISDTKNSITLRFSLPKNTNLNLILGQRLNIEFSSTLRINNEGVNNVK